MDSTISTRPSSIEIDDVIAILRCYYLDSLVLVNETFLQDLRFLLQAKGATFIEPLNQSRSLSEVPSMTQLLTHTIAHSTRPSFSPQNNNQPTKKFLILAVS